MAEEIGKPSDVAALAGVPRGMLEYQSTSKDAAALIVALQHRLRRRALGPRALMIALSPVAGLAAASGYLALFGTADDDLLASLVVLGAFGSLLGALICL